MTKSTHCTPLKPTLWTLTSSRGLNLIHSLRDQLTIEHEELYDTVLLPLLQTTSLSGVVFLHAVYPIPRKRRLQDYPEQLPSSLEV